MAVYKVAQDVEADDHLLGPFTARQFIYLVIMSMAAMIAFFLWRLFVPLAILPLPIILFFGVLALPLRKDQPMEVYFAALISFYLKPRRRLWVPDGVTSLVEITAPQAAEQQRTKDFTGSEAESRLGYLASIVDTEGWAIRHAATGGDQANTSMISDVYNDAVATLDPLDTESTVAQGFEDMLNKANQKHRQDILNRMRAPAPVAPPAATPQAPAYTPAAQPTTPPPVQPSDVHFNPYPSIHQSVIQPLSTDDQLPPSQPAAVPQPAAPPAAAPPAPSANTAKSTSETTVSPDIIKLVNNPDLSVETIAREAHRIKGKDDGEEVVISLR